jgi:hypothetical protein
MTSDKKKLAQDVVMRKRMEKFESHSWISLPRV